MTEKFASVSSARRGHGWAGLAQVPAIHAVPELQLHAGYLHWQPVLIEGARGAATTFETLEVPAGEFTLPIAPGEVHHNVALAYAAFAGDLLHGTSRSADFAAAVARHETIDAISRAAAADRT
jgi:hypothetical protein